jgi:imidazolonepropionase-like amidohydrolase/Tol biopolymer transport system component
MMATRLARLASLGAPGAMAALGTMAALAALVTAQAAVAQPGGAADAATRTISFTTSECTSCAFDLSPDGSWLVVDLLGQLWRIPAQGGAAVPLTDAVAAQAEDLSPGISPDGRWIAFHGDRAGREGLWIMPAEGGAARLLSGTELSQKPWFSDQPSAWSPDGRHLAFTRGAHLHLHHLDRDTTTQVEVANLPPGQLRGPRWLPDGRIAVVRQEPWSPGGALWLVDPWTGVGEEAGPSGIDVIAFEPAPDGRRIAFFAEDDEARVQLWLQSAAGGPPERLTDAADVVPLTVRWSPDGEELLYSAAGRLWRLPIGGGQARETPFTARIEFERTEPVLPPVRFAEPGAEVPARGHMGLALSPAGDRIALIALGRLWVWTVGEDPRPVADLPVTAEWPSWAPDGSQVAWSAGRAGLEDLFATDLRTGRTRRVTALPGRADRPAWSPDGESIAFYYWPGMGTPDAHGGGGRVAVIPAAGAVVRDPAQVHVPAPEAVFQLFGFGSVGQERPVWSPGSDALVLPGRAGGLRAVSLAGEPIPLGSAPDRITFLAWAADASLIYVRGNQLWQATTHATSGAEPVRLTEEAALYPSVARDGTILYVSTDGYRLRRPDGSTSSLGWPLRYRLPVPEPLLIRAARIIDGTGAAPGGPSDVLVENGRITRIGAAGSVQPGPGVRIIDAGGRTLMPGLIDLHQHGWDEDDVVYAGSLYHGATTIREMGGAIARNAAAGDAITAGIQPGARVILGGFQLYPDGAFGGSGSGVQNPVGQAEWERALDLAQAFGASYAKMRLPGNWSAGAGMVRLAHARGMRIGGHCAHPLPLIAAGVDQIEHLVVCNPRSRGHPRDDLVQLYRAARLTAVPSLVMFATQPLVLTRGAQLLADPEIGSFLPPFLRFAGGYRQSVNEAQLAYVRRGIDIHRTAAGALQRGGIPLAAGTDVPGLPGAIHGELEELVRIGLTPMAALVAATSTAARVLGAEHEIGTVEVGRIADLLLLDADPLEDIRNTRRIWQVIQGGRVVDREALREWARAHQHRVDLP